LPKDYHRLTHPKLKTALLLGRGELLETIGLIITHVVPLQRVLVITCVQDFSANY